MFKFVNLLLVTCVLSLSTLSPAFANKPNVLTLGLTEDDSEFGRGGVITYERVRGENVLADHGLYLKATSHSENFGDGFSVDIYAFTVGGSFSTGSAFKARAGLTLNTGTLSTPFGDFDEDEIGVDLGVLYLIESH